MTQEEMQFNQLCHEFLFPNAKEEYESGEISIEDGLFSKAMGIFGDFNLMKYHSDWNWIHKILDRIKSITEFKNSYTNNTKKGLFNVIISKTCLSETTTVEISFNVDYDFRKMVFTESEDEKEAVIQAINQFLIWYNENNKQDA